MQLDPRFQELLDKVNAGIDGGDPPKLPPVRGGGSGGDMEGRIIKLEAHMEHVREDLKSLADVPKDLATLTAHVAHLPSKGFIVSVLTTGVAVIGGLVLMADRIKNLF